MSAIRVSVPASTANLGPGFDALGLALELRNELELSRTDGESRAEVEGEGAAALSSGADNLALRSVAALLEHTGRAGCSVRLRAFNRIPLAAGLGSSAATIVAALAGANRLFDTGLDAAALLALAERIEGHPDNVAASLYGGLNIVAAGEPRCLVRRVELPPLRVVVVTPDFGLSTGETRAALPRAVPLADAVFNLGRALLVVEALRSGDWELLGRALDDRLHQPHRAQRIPGYHAVVAAARGAGAAAVALSGGGPSLAAFAASGHRAVGEAAVKAWRQSGVEARAFELEVAKRGVILEAVAEPAAGPPAG